MSGVPPVPGFSPSGSILVQSGGARGLVENMPGFGAGDGPVAHLAAEQKLPAAEMPVFQKPLHLPGDGRARRGGQVNGTPGQGPFD